MSLTISQATDHLIDVLAGSDIPVSSPTIAGVVYTLADKISDGTIVLGGGGESGYTVTTTPLFSETVTTAGDMGNAAALAYAGDPTALGTLAVTLNGTDYTCAQQSGDGQYWWGAPSPNDFSEYPFVILAAAGTWRLITETAGEYTVTASSNSITTTANFQAAVNNVVGTILSPMECVDDTTTYDEMLSAYRAGRILFFRPYGGNSFAYRLVTDFDQNSITITPTDAGITVAFDGDGVFTVTEGN